MIFRNNYFGSHPLFMSYYFTKIFVQMLAIAAVYNFSVYKLIGWDPTKVYSKSTIETIEKGVKYVQS